MNSKDGKGRIAIIGAGVSGLGIGWRLAQAGLAVDIFERDRAGSGASDAAAGMLAAGVECEPSEESLLPLTRLAQDMWPAFRDELEAAAGQDIGYRDEGTLVVAPTQDDMRRLRFLTEFQQGLGIALEWLSGSEARRLEPHLKPGIAAAVYSAADHQVDNRKLVRALAVAFERAGGRLHERSEVTGLIESGGRVRGLQLGEERHEADAVVLAAGAWSRLIPGLAEADQPPVRPVKGQMLALAMDPQMPLLERVLWAPGLYLVPRDDGRLIVGATVEEKGFDESLTAGGLYALLEATWRVLPSIEELPVVETWVGFRPTSRDDAPILGPAGCEGLWIATGHHRNGILLAPLTADAMSEAILGGEMMPAVRPFGMERFRDQAAPAGQAVPKAAGGGRA